jgi:uncharacterized protein YbgA (DUF1722 family)
MTKHYDKQWHMKYEQLVEFKQKNGHCMVPKSYEQDKSLGHWVSKQRKCRNNNTIRQDRKIILNEIGFSWKVEVAYNFKPDDKLWHQQYEKLVEFRRKKGHCIVPTNHEQDKSLGRWVERQRRNHKNDKMLRDRQELLDELEFAWKVDSALTFKPKYDKLWHQQYEKLLEYKRKNGHCNVPQTKNEEQDKSLGDWVHTQRTLHNNNKLGIDRKRILDGIGFVWKPDRAHRALKPDGKLWHQQYEKLLEYKRKNGHCKVPTKYKDDKSLGAWVGYQRRRHANNKMLPEGKELLDALEFVWKADTVATRSSTTDVRGLAI